MAIRCPEAELGASPNQTEPVGSYQKSKGHLSLTNLGGVKNSAVADYIEATIKSDPFLLLEKYELD